MNKQSIKGKRRARRLALQALYQWDMAKHDLSEIEAQFHREHVMEKADLGYFQQLLYGIPKHLSVLETNLLPFLDRPIHELNPIELAVLRLGAFELIYSLEIPYKVVLDEAISMTKEFGSQDGYRYVNGVLNNLARKIRTVEISEGNG